MDFLEPLHILRQLGISFLDTTDSFVTRIITEVANNLLKKEHDEDKVTEVATKLLPFVNHKQFTPIWVSLLRILPVCGQKDEVSELLMSMTKKEMEFYKTGIDWMPLPVLEQLFLVYLPSLEQRVLIMLDKIISVDDSHEIEAVIKNSHLVPLCQREPHVHDCICSILDALTPYSPKVGHMKTMFSSFVIEIPDT